MANVKENGSDKAPRNPLTKEADCAAAGISPP